MKNTILIVLASVITALLPPVPLQAAQKKINRPIADKWALLIGIDRFKDKRIPTLRYSSKDASDFANFLVRKGNFASDHVLLLLNEQATFKNIESALGDTYLPRRVMPDDLVVIFVSTHGSPKELDVGKDNWLIAHDTNIDELFSTGIELASLARTVKKRTNCDRIVLILDACNSGAAEAAGGKGLTRTHNFKINSIVGEGEIVISSSDANQRSWESKRYKNGVFTRNLIAALQSQNTGVSLKKVFATTKEKVAQEVRFDRKVDQTPVLKSRWKGKALALLAPPSRPRHVDAPAKTILRKVASSAAPSTTAVVDTTSPLSKQIKGLVKSRSYTEAVELAKKGAENGDLECIKLLGNFYFSGTGTQKDQAKGLEWWHKAAAKSYPPAQHNIGQAYFDGNGVAKNYATAVIWFQKAAARNFAKSQYALFLCYKDGLGVETDRKRMLKLLSRAAKQKEPMALNAMGVLLRDGIAMPVNYKLARELFSTAATRGNADAQYNLGLLYYQGIGVDKNYARAVEWFQKAALLNNANAQNALGNCYSDGTGAPADQSLALKWFQKAADNNSAEAQYNLGMAYSNGNGVPIDYEKAVQYFRKSADQSNPFAILHLGRAYYHGHGVVKDLNKAVSLFRKGAALGNPNCQNALAELYYDGKGVKKDLATAIKLLKKSAAQNCPEAQTNLGWAYMKGKGVKKDKAVARRYFELAAGQGDKDAAKYLSKMKD